MATPEHLKKSLLELLDDYIRRWPEENDTAERFRRLLKEQVEVQGKTDPRAHITASAWIVSPDRQRVLLTHHKNLGIWVQLGGHTDPGEPWLEAALREAQEESGLKDILVIKKELFDLDIHLIPPRKGQDSHLHYDLRFLMEADNRLPLNISEESLDLAWVNLSNLEDYTLEESQHRMKKKTPSAGV